MDSVRNILLDQFNECERIRSLDNLFNFRDSEKSLTMDFGGSFFVNLVPQARKRVKMILGKNPLGAKGVKTQKQTVKRLVYKVCKRCQQNTEW